MPTREIYRSDWVEFFDNFSRAHRGWLVTIEVFGAELGAQIEAREMPFEGVTADLITGGERIAITMGDRPDSHLTHTITSPTRVSLDQTEGGEHEALQILCESGATTLARFRPGALPDLVADTILE